MGVLRGIKELNVKPTTEISAFGELITATISPQAQISAVYGVRRNTRVLDQLSASVSEVDGQFKVSTGTTAFAVGAAVTQRPLIYKSGQGALCRISARFDVGAADAVLGAGLFSNTEGLFFGYNGTEFTIFHTRQARASIQTLTLTSFATGAETATFTIDGTGHSVSLTGVGTLAGDAHEIEEQLNGMVANWEIHQNGNTVVINQTVPLVTTGAFTYSSATSAGSIVQDHAGVDTTNTFIPQADWNRAVDSAFDSQVFNPQNFNVFQVKYQYLGAGTIEFSIENAETGAFDLVHVVAWPNANQLPSLGNPSLFGGWLARSLGGTTDLSVHGISCLTAIEGVDDATTDTNFSFSFTQTTTLNEQSHFILRARAVFNDRLNLGVVEASHISVANDGNKACIVRVYLQAGATAATNFAYISEADSVVEVSTVQSALSAPKPPPFITFVVPKGGNGEFDLTILEGEVEANSFITITTEMESGADSSVTVSVVWKEIV